LQSRRWIWWTGSLVVLAVMAGVLWWRLHPRTPTVQVTQVTRETIEDEVYTSGIVRPVRSQVVFASALPAPVDEVRVHPGQRVHRGDVLVTLQSTPSALRSVPGLNAVRAKFDGIVLSVDEDGVDAGGNPAPVVQLVSADKQVVAQVSQVDAVRIRAGMTVRLSSDAYPNQSWTGEVARVADYATTAQTGGTGQVEVDIRPPAGFPVPVGYDLDVRIQRQTDTKALVVPYSALVPRGNGFGVWVVTPAHTVHEVAVTVGITTDTQVEVIKGLSAGQRVVINPPADLREGERVSVS
jgi:multidrug efflux pump subunit AcrA (membrane-fusion protein)